MKQKYDIIKDRANRQLIIREYAELDKDSLSLLCEETYDNKAIRAAMSQGLEELVSTLRTKNLYPPGDYARKIAEAVAALYKDSGRESTELFFDDLELLGREAPPAAPLIEDIVEEQESAELDELLEEDLEDEKEIKKIDSSLKIADDDYMELDEES